MPSKLSRSVTSPVVLVASMGIARKGVPEWDRRSFLAVNRLPDAIAPVIWGPMQAGALAAPIVTSVFLLIRGDRPRAVRIATTGIASWVVAKGVKRVVARGRPGEFIEETRLRMGSADKGLGFPSGHAAVAVAVASGITHDGGPAVRLAGLALAALVGMSRVYVGAHFPLDVIGGWAIGSLLGDAFQLGDAMVARSMGTGN